MLLLRQASNHYEASLGSLGKGAPLRPPNTVREADRCGPRGTGLGHIRPVPRTPIPILLKRTRRLASTSPNRRSDTNGPEVAIRNHRWGSLKPRDDDDTEAQLEHKPRRSESWQDIFDLLVSPGLRRKETYPRPESLTAIALEDARTSVRDRSAHQALAASCRVGVQKKPEYLPVGGLRLAYIRWVLSMSMWSPRCGGSS